MGWQRNALAAPGSARGQSAKQYFPSNRRRLHRAGGTEEASRLRMAKTNGMPETGAHPMTLNTDHLKRCIQTLRSSLTFYEKAEPKSIDQEIFRNNTAHDYGENFANQTLVLIPGFITDVARLEAILRERCNQEQS